MDQIEQAMGRYAMTDVEFTFLDFAALQGSYGHPEDLEGIPPMVMEIMNGRANELMSGTEYSQDINEVRARSLDEIIEELENPPAED